MPNHYVHHRLLQLPAACETREDAVIVLEALHRAYGGRQGMVVTKIPHCKPPVPDPSATKETTDE